MAVRIHRPQTQAHKTVPISDASHSGVPRLLTLLPTDHIWGFGRRVSGLREAPTYRYQIRKDTAQEPPAGRAAQGEYRREGSRALCRHTPPRTSLCSMSFGGFREASVLRKLGSVTGQW